MPMKARGGLAMLGAVAAVSGMLAFQGTLNANAKSQGSDWCGWSIKADWACKWRGSTYLNNDPLLTWKPRQLHESTTVSTTRGGSTRVALRHQARCSVGTGDRESEIVTRPSPDVLLRQLRGNSICGTPHRVKIELCTLLGCHTQLRSQGVAIAQVMPEEATMSTTERFHHRIVIVSCSGFISVSADGQFASGGANTSSRFVIEVDESSFFLEDETRTETPTEVRVEANSEAGQEVKVVEIGELPGRGPCKARVVQEEERELQP